MLYAVVDIETTGGHAASHGITEIAIYIHDGTSVTERYESLVNPCQHIPLHIQSLTGISNEMVENAPVFSDIAGKVYELLQDKIFVAHHVNFDYSFVYHHLAACGYTLNVKKLCTVRLSRKLFPGLASYSLGKLCNSLSIPLHNRHRAGGDTAATTILLGRLLAKDTENMITDTLKRSSKEQVLPPNLQKDVIENLPQTPGVYYFKNQKGKVIYVGKAKNLKKRVCSHFTGNNASRQRQHFLRDIFHIDFEICGTALMALILEASEIKKLWPENNRAMKRFEQKYALYHFEDQNGYMRLGIDKYRKSANVLYSFNQLLEGHHILRMMAKEHQLCEKLCFIQKGSQACTAYGNGACIGACMGKEKPDEYNARVENAILQLQKLLPSFVLIDNGRHADEKSCIWVEKGVFYGMGYLSENTDINDLESLKSNLQPYQSNDYILNLILNYSLQYPQKKISI